MMPIKLQGENESWRKDAARRLDDLAAALGHMLLLLLTVGIATVRSGRVGGGGDAGDAVRAVLPARVVKGGREKCRLVLGTQPRKRSLDLLALYGR